jgi:hypothetical protein
MKAQIIKLFIYTLITFSLFDASASNIYNQKNFSLPCNIKKILQDSISGYYIPNKNQYIEEWKEYEQITEPMFAFSDFNGDSKQDYGIVLISKENNKVIFVVIVSFNDSYKIYKIKTFEISEKLIDIFISVEKKGYWESASEKKQIKYDGINVVWASASLSFSYYWYNNGFKRFLYD